MSYNDNAKNTANKTQTVELHNGHIVQVINGDSFDVNYNWHIAIEFGRDNVVRCGQTTDKRLAIDYACKYANRMGYDPKQFTIVLEPKQVI